MGRFISNRKINEKTDLTKCTDGFYLYDENRGMNIAMYCLNEIDALEEGLEYYQKRLLEVESHLAGLQAKVDIFLGMFENEENDD